VRAQALYSPALRFGSVRLASSKVMRRAAWLVSSLLITIGGLLVITFVIGRVLPIDPVLAVVGDHATPEVYEIAKHRLGLDQPVWHRFELYIAAIARGDLGVSIITGKPVLEDIARVFPATVELATIAVFLGVVLGVPMGVIAASRHGRWPDHVLRVVGIVGYSAPVFWLGLVALVVFYSKLGWSAGPGRLGILYEGTIEPITGVILIDSLLRGEPAVFRDALAHVLLPAAVLGYYSMAYISRMTRSFMLDQLKQEYITTARVKGMSEARVIWRHAFGNIAVPLVTVIALTYAGLLEGAVLTETVFAWPGIGQYITSSLFSADMNAVLGGTVVVGLVFVCLNLLADAVHGWIDVRARRT
jgi:peptide/nickel transport system permease protein